jgi:ribosomal protein L11 methyltransferase
VTSPSWRVSTVVPAAAVTSFEAAFASLCDAVACFEAGGDAWRIDGTCRLPPDATELDIACRLAAAATGLAPPAVRITPIDDRDWVAAVNAQLPPVRAGRFLVYGRHHRATLAVRPGEIGLAIDAGLAFGTGHHASTEGCLLALSRLARRPVRRALDLGCGSGILAIAIAKRWHARVVAADIDPRAVATARENARHNGVGPLIRCLAADGISGGVSQLAPYDLIVANILASPLRRLAGAVCAHLAVPGRLILAGFLESDRRLVGKAYAARGLRPLFGLRLGEWTTLVFERAVPG